MAILDKLKELTKKGQQQAADHKDDLQKAVDKAQEVADKRTGGKYHDKIEKAGAKADRYIDKLQASKEGESGEAAETPEDQGPGRGAG